MGKMIGGGFPVGALAGSDDAMDVFVRGDKQLRLPLSGTFSANPVTMVAGYTAMSLFDRDQVGRLNGLADYARNNLAEVIKSADVPACVTGAGSLLRIHLKPQAPKNYREAFLSPDEARAVGALVRSLYDRGIMMIHTCSAALSTPMGTAEIDRLCEAVHGSLISIRPLILDPVAAE
jgi:glutamate-1-semialdehyde 2,1-aminomutase